MSITEIHAPAVDRSRAIDLLRASLLDRIGDDKSACRWAAERGVFCRGFKRFGDQELRDKYDWITRRRPHMTRIELEEIADRWQLARQDVGEMPIACDVQEREHDMCAGWSDFSNDQLGYFLFEITGTTLSVV